jgi:diguanylate cyclase (GGDEF)-like protein
MRFGLRKAIEGQNWRLSAKLLIASSVVTVLGFSAICASVMLDMRRGEEELARETLENLASSINSDISRNLELYDLSLRDVASDMLMPEIQKVSKAVRNLILFDHTAAASHFGAIQVFDAEGQLILDSTTLDPEPENRREEEFFQIHRDRLDEGLFISRPMLHRGVYSLVLSRRLNDAEGRFAGVVAGSIRFSYFHDLFGHLHLGQNDIITVLRHDGTVIMRTPFDLDVIGKNIGKSPTMARALSEPSGWSSGVGAVDGVARLRVWRGDQPLIVLVGKPWSDILSLWHKEAIRIAAIMLALIAFVLGVTLFLAGEIGRRARAEDKLEELATTDALTGLKNRRKFDAEIESEWRRAQRQKTPLALLMIDADHFKSYNDTFGHQAGDQMLIGIGICISDAVRRAGDCTARYGGEEFAVLLPGLSPAEALSMAETIRLKVQQWADGPTTTTVSIGIASVTPNATMEWSELIEIADKALYMAKAEGRNRSVLASPPKLSLVA